MTLPGDRCGRRGRNGCHVGGERTHVRRLSGIPLEYGPVILLVSIALVTIGLALRRPWAAVPSLAAGAVLYWGMYAQASYFVMYVSLALGFAA